MLPVRELQRVTYCVAATSLGLWGTSGFPQTEQALLPFSLATARWTELSASWLGVGVTREGTLLSHRSGFASEIDYTCTALVPVALMAAALLATSAQWKGKLFGIAYGVLLIVFLNQVRLASIIWVGAEAPALFGLVHGWLWPVALIVAIGTYWWMWRRMTSS